MMKDSRRILFRARKRYMFGKDHCKVLLLCVISFIIIVYHVIHHRDPESGTNSKRRSLVVRPSKPYKSHPYHARKHTKSSALSKNNNSSLSSTKDESNSFKKLRKVENNFIQYVKIEENNSFQNLKKEDHAPILDSPKQPTQPIQAVPSKSVLLETFKSDLKPKETIPILNNSISQVNRKVYQKAANEFVHKIWLKNNTLEINKFGMPSKNLAKLNNLLIKPVPNTSGQSFPKLLFESHKKFGTNQEIKKQHLLSLNKSQTLGTIASNAKTFSQSGADKNSKLHFTNG
ncbi:uncharacterized protein LOC131946478 [Physella acuta]|uniref:uncharacterized protein LOC131946478 n=1 Tax=Physella acuta TaxID=109671 RepID=UPI0027DB0333|nr:uncharacterized protein LOC131946478 [Physella acuta]